jgi:sulfotransferase
MERVRKQLICLSGLPRSGSTLLSSILHQNPLIHAEGNSAVCQLMWDVQRSCQFECNEQLIANNRWDTQSEIVGSIFHTYYASVDRPIVVDKCRSWTLPANMEMIRNYLDAQPKVIVLTRDIDEIAKSFVQLYKRNNKEFSESDLFVEGSEPLMRSLDGLNYAKENNNGEFFFIDYSSLVSDTQNVIDDLYNFLELESFAHDFNNIVNENQENDAVYGLMGMHEVRSKVGRRDEVQQ